MTYVTNIKFVQELQQALTEVPSYISMPTDYIDLSHPQIAINDAMLSFSHNTIDNPFQVVFLRIVQSGNAYLLQQVQLGCNEIFKAYLLQITQENQEIFTVAYVQLLQELFIWCLDSPFLYLSHFWRYLIDCLKTVTHYILEQEYFDACNLLIKHLGYLGQGAVKHGLSTQRIQRLLRTLEVKADEMSWIEGSRQCYQQRHDIEIT